MTHPFYPGGNPRLNHVAMSVPADQLDEANRADLVRYFHDVFGLRRLDMMTVDRHRLIFSCVHWDQFIFLIAEDDPMKCPRMDHFGFSVSSRAELDAAWERAVEFRKQDPRHRHRRPGDRRPGRGEDPLDLSRLQAAADV